MRRRYRVRETTEYTVDAETEEEAEQLFASRGPEGAGVEPSVEFVTVRDRVVDEVRNDRGLAVVVVAPY